MDCVLKRHKKKNIVLLSEECLLGSLNPSLIIYVISVLFCYACLFVDALWSPAGKGLNSWLSFVMSNCDVVTFPLVSWVRCGA